jgi:thiol:disulfide interchange protein DsbG
MKLRTSFIALSALISTTVFAQAYSPVQPSPELQEKVAKVLGKNAQTIKYFDSGFDDLIAITIVSKQMKKHTFFTNDNGEFFMAGNLIDGKHQVNLTPQFEQLVDIEYPQSMKDEISSFPAVTQGQSSMDENIVYVVIDPNCGFCHRLYSNIQGHFDSGEFENVQVRWIPVGFLGQDSQTKAYSMASLIETDPLQASTLLQRLMTKQAPQLPNNLMVKPDSVLKTEKFMRDYGFGGVPFVMMKSNDKWTMSSGLPQPQFFASVISQAQELTPITPTEE